MMVCCGRFGDDGGIISLIDGVIVESGKARTGQLP